MLCKHGLCCHAVCVCEGVSVCVTVTFVHSVKTNKHILKIFSPSGSHTILVFPYQTAWQYFDRNPVNGGVECRWGRQKSRFWANIWLHYVLWSPAGSAIHLRPVYSDATQLNSTSRTWRRELDVELSWVELSCVAINGPLAATGHVEFITLVAGERRSLLMVGNNDEVYDKKPQRYAEDNAAQW